MNPCRFGIGLALTCLTLPFGVAVAAGIEIAAEPDALVKAMRGRSIVLLGEVHDNAAQHALRAAALRLLIAEGARPAIAFEQFDRERQADIDRARRERPGDVDYLIAQGKGAPSWNWPLYRPFIQLALDHDLPIVAANLSRGEAMRLAMDTASTGAGSPYDSLSADFRRAHEDMIAKGHCNLLPTAALPGMAVAQVARDRTLAQALGTWAGRGVVLLTGNGHARTDIGIPHWLSADERAASVAIGLLERDDADPDRDSADRFDVVVLTPAAARPDPCVELAKRMGPGAGKDRGVHADSP